MADPVVRFVHNLAAHLGGSLHPRFTSSRQCRRFCGDSGRSTRVKPPITAFVPAGSRMP
jgi:hypothetical protein